MDAKWTTLPHSIHNTEDLCQWLMSEGKGLSVDMEGRVMQPKGGYDKDKYNMVWHEKPHPHWYLQFLPGNTRIRNGGICVAERIALVCEGPSIEMQSITFEGLADPVSDLRNAVICKGGATSVDLTEVTFKGMGCYVWEDADAVMTGCSFDGGMHGVYAWGRCKVHITGCNINGTEKSGVCIRDGVTLSMQETTSTNAKTGSGVWAGPQSTAKVISCKLTGNESFAIESNYSKANVDAVECDLSGNIKGETDTWKGGQLTVQ